ncbi:phosphatase PAP2 family protein [Pseudorhodoplanes sp.]|uniref:phosphatase PAP2 family protein n=1 Tax=Pseudorhodoplanes sp. TaxID=1934341 RepID=UPI003D1030FD
MPQIGLLIIVAVTVFTAVVFTIDPALDLEISALFFDPARRIFPAKSDWFLAGFRFVTSWAVAIAIIIPAAALIGKMLFPSRQALLPGRAMLLILMSIAIGPGLLVNAGLKENWNRPRPGVVKEFGGAMEFKPWWDASGTCRGNCSFVSGESAAAFAMLAPAALVAAPWQLPAIGLATVFGALMGLLRVVFGGHFFTDVVFAGALTALLVWALHGWMYRWVPGMWSDQRIEQALGDAGCVLRDSLVAAGKRVAAIPAQVAAGVGLVFGRASDAAPRRG